MEESLLRLAAAESLPEIRTRLGAHLGLEGPVDEAVVRAAVLHPDFGRRLMAAAGSPELVRHLLAAAPKVDPGHLRFRALNTNEAASMSPASSIELAAQASASLLRWATRGFKPVDDLTYARRWNACLNCENLAEPPSRAIHKIVGTLLPEKRVCRLCGCVAASKARIPHESCPGTHAIDPTLTRWGEARVSHRAVESRQPPQITTRRQQE
ncbi:MAG: hypothetical protein JNM76_18170 [Betaproteobacteria bacterium]|nr:hypothetical protein [Betaproteobacteria bacterium]